MAVFPKIQNPCPYKSQLSAIMEGDTCRMCKRQVVDITAMSDAQRVNLIAGCKTEVCVSYRLPAGAVVAAALAAAAMAAPMTAAAAEGDATIGEVTITASTTVSYYESEVVVVGGITDPQNAEYISDGVEDTTPALPVVYETSTPTQAAAPPAEPTAS